MKKRVLSQWLALTMAVMLAAGCADGSVNAKGTADGITAEQDIAAEVQADMKNAAQINLSQGSRTISRAGTYVLSGTLSDGQVVVDSSKEAEVVLVLNGVDITCKNSAAICVKKAKSVTILAAEGTVNKVADGKEYCQEAVNEEITGAIFCKSDLIIGGSGQLEVTGNYKHGVICKDNLTISDVVLTVSAAKDGIHGKDSIKIVSGTFGVTAGDDGIHSDGGVCIDDGTVTVSKSEEGIEGKMITINGGVINVTSSDDGINAADGSSTDKGMGQFGKDSSPADGGIGIVINGGTVVINASGDGIDSNQSFTINGGELYVNGPTGNGDSAIDFESRYGGFINGGTVAAVGSAGMVESMSGESGQCSVTVFMDTVVPAGAELTLKDENGEALVTFTPAKSWQCAIVSSPAMTEGRTYTVTAGDTSVEVTLEGRTTVYGQTGRNNGWFGGRGNGDFGDMPENFNPKDMPENFNPKDMPENFNPNPENRKNFKDIP